MRNSIPRLVSILALCSLLLTALPITAAQPLRGGDKIEAALLDRFDRDGASDFVLVMAKQADLSAAYIIRDWNTRGQYVYDTLREVARLSQAEAQDYLSKRGFRFQSFFTGNELYVYAGDLQAAQFLAGLEDVALVRAPRTYYVDPILSTSGPAPQAITDWGITDTGADQFWAQLGVQGEGIIVANIDTGVQWNHPALDQAYKCPSNPTDPACWLDPSNTCGGSVCDNNGHGTHTMGTMVADDDPTLTYIAGMAPNAQFIMCKGCETNSCSDASLNACADWIVAPGGDPANRPHVVNNSWGGGGGDPWYQGKVQAWVAAGVFPAFSAGNSGSSCSTLGSPGDYQESFGSAAHDSTRTVASFSSRGPSTYGHDPYTKPNISAPGVNICSSVPTNSWDCTYSGTSMASPHTAGAVALLWSCNAALVGQIDQTFQILQDYADAAPAGNCGAPPDGEGNYTYGYGYLNVLAAGLQNCVSAWGVLNGHVRNAQNAAPIADATVTAQRHGGGMWSGATDASGYYTLTVGAGTYTVTAAHPHYTTASDYDIVVATGTVVTDDLNLQPRGRLYGYVTDADSGAPLGGTVTVAGVGSTPTDPATGYYEIYLDAGTYNVTADAPDYVSQTVSIDISAGQNLQEDFALLAQVAVVPDPIHATVQLGQTGNVVATMINHMPVPYPFHFYEMEAARSLDSSGGPDPFGYTYKDSNEPGGPRYTWIDATDGTALNLADDGEVGVVIPFAFTFYGQASTDLCVGNNGGGVFGVSTCDLSTANADLGATTYNNLIVPFWDDIDSDTGNVYVKTVGTAPFRQFVVEWFDRPHYSNVGSGTFELVLYEGTNNIKYQYLDTNFGNVSYDYGASATAGIRQQGTNYLQYSYNQPVLVDNLAICFQYPGSPPCDPTDVPWYGTSVVQGTVPANSTLPWTNYFTATPAVGVYQPGEYNATLLIQPEGGPGPVKRIGVLLTVLPTPTMGRLQGTVTSDRPGGPLEADILIESGGITWTLIPSPDTGFYSYWLEAGTYNVTASASGYVPSTASVLITAQQTTTADFELNLLAPWIQITPPAVQRTLVFGDVGTETLTIANAGLLPLDYQLFEAFSGGAANVLGSGGPDPFGYTYKDSNEPGGPIYTWIDATDGTALNLSDDAEATVAIPFPFTFYDVTSTNLCVGNNGGALLNPTTCDLPNTNVALASATTNNLIVPFWDDIDADTGNVYYKTVGTAPLRQFVVEWYDRPHYSNVGSATFELVLYEGTNNVKYQYLDTNFGNAAYDYGASATCGIRRQGANYLQYSFDQPVLVDNLAICFQFPGSQPCDSQDVPWLAESPTSGTIPVGNSAPVGVGFYSAATDGPGVYTADLWALSNDPLNGMVRVPVTLTVLPSATMGDLVGTVTSNRPGGPLEAEILIESSTGMTWTRTTDPATGHYERWLIEGTYTVTASAAGYVPSTVSVQVTAQQTVTQDFQLELLAPWAVVQPDRLEQTLPLSSTAVQTMTITNAGLLPLTYRLAERNGSYIPLPQANTILLMGDDLTSAYWDIYRTALAYAGVSWDEWDLLTQPFPTAGELAHYELLIWTDNDVIDPGDAECQIVADWLVSGGKALFGVGRDFLWDLANGTPGMGEYNLYLLLSTTYLGDYAGTTITTLDGVPGDPIGGDFVSPDGLTLAGTLDSNGDYADETIGAPTGLVYGPGGTGSGRSGLTHQEAANFKTVWLGVNFHNGLANQDQRNQLMENALAFLVGLDVPWLSEEPITGTLQPGDMVEVTVTFDAGAVSELGIYTADLAVQSNDPLAGNQVVPVTMTVLPSGDMGRLEGTVTGTGYCGQDNYPLEAQLLLSAGGVTQTLVTDPAGRYQAWLVAGTYTVTVGAPAHLGEMAVVTVTAGLTTTQDFALRSLQPCMDVTPLAYSLTLPVGVRFTDTLTLDNAGAGPLTWELHETWAMARRISIPAFQGTIPPDTAPPSIGRAPNAPQYVPTTGVRPLNSAPAFAVDVYPGENLVFFDTATPGTWNIVAPEPGNTFFGGTFLNGDVSKLYVVDYTLNQLITLDTTSGAQTVVGPAVPSAGEFWTGLTDGLDGTLYGAASTCSSSSLYTLDPDTGATTVVGPITNGACIIDIAMNATGEMYGVDIVNDVLVQIDPATGAGTVIGPVGINANYAQGMGFEKDTGVLYWASYGTQGELRTIDTTTGASTLVGAFPGGAEVDAFAVQLSCMSPLACEPPLVDVPWVSEVPTAGVVLPDSAFPVDVVFDTAGLVTNTCYTASLALLHDDAGWGSPLYIPLTLCVTALTTPTASFESNAPVCFQQPVVFTNTSTDAVTYLWAFGDGITSTLEHPTHVYATAGTYEVVLTASNPLAWDVYSAPVEVRPLPVAGFTYDTAGLTVTFTNASANATTYEWAFGDALTSTLENPVHTYAAAGTYTVTLWATGDCGTAEASQVLVVTVCDQVEILTVTTGIQGCIVTLGAQLTGDPPFTYAWDLGAFGTYTDTSPVVDFLSAGTYTGTLQVWNCADAGHATQAFSVDVTCARAYNIYLPLIVKTGQ